jgi:hypothetical protein
LLDYNNEAGVAGQVLSSTATGVDWIDVATSSCLWEHKGDFIYGLVDEDGCIITKVQKLEVIHGEHSSTFTHDCGEFDIGSYNITNATVTRISLINLTQGHQGTLFIESTVTGEVEIKCYSDASSTEIPKVYGSKFIQLFAGEATTVTYTCMKNGGNSSLRAYLISSNLK